MKTNFSPRDLTEVRLLTAFLSLLLSTAVIGLNDVLNSDGILYVYSIEAIKAGGLNAFSAFYNWPLFSFLVSTLSTLTGLNVELMAKIVCTFFYVLVTDAILLLCSISLDRRSHLLLAALLTISFYTLNDYRDFIIRDIGYWAFSLYGLYYLFAYVRTNHLNYALLWQFFTFLAFLFRIEAIVFLIAIPILISIRAQKGHRLSTLSLLSIFTVALMLLFGLAMILTPDSGAFEKVLEISRYIDIERLFRNFYSNTNLIASEILHPAADEYAFIILSSGLFTAVMWEFVSSITIPFVVFLVWAIALKNPWKRPQQQFEYLCLLMINLAVLFFFAMYSQLITTRYFMLTSILALLIIMPTLINFIESQFDNPNKSSKYIVAIIIIMSLADTLISTGAKPFLRELPEWAAGHVPPDQKVMTNDFTAQYYFNKDRVGEMAVLDSKLNHYSEYDYILLSYKTKNSQMLKKLESLQIQLVKEAGNDDNNISFYAVSK